jgi:hypothetical protein
MVKRTEVRGSPPVRLEQAVELALGTMGKAMVE